MSYVEYTVKVYDGEGEYWYQDDVPSRLGGLPAVIRPNGYRAYMEYGKFHRVDGPAIVYPDGSECYYLNDILMTKEEYEAATNPAKELTVAEIEKLLGHKVKIVK